MIDNTTRALSTDQLEVGMVVHVHGARFRLAEKILDNSDGKYADRQLTLRAFSTEFLGNADAGRPHGIPSHWVADWSVQGNHFAMWHVEA
ncbi:TPA: hypothetical protein ACOECQ_000803 [Stenotrophomonas maltophilia]